MKKLLKIELNGSLSVEASMVVPICLFIIMDLIILGFGVYDESLKFISENPGMNFDGISAFRWISAGKDFLDFI